MKAVVVYESMYGNTHLIADEIGNGLASAAEVAVVPVEQAGADMLAGADLVVVGGPTHAHSMSRVSTRKAAADAAKKPGSELELDAAAHGPGLREWFDSIARLPRRAAAFDTRMHGPAFFTGRASKGIAKRLRRHGCTVVAKPESFLVTRQNRLDPNEAEHAREWGRRLADVPVTVH